MVSRHSPVGGGMELGSAAGVWVRGRGVSMQGTYPATPADRDMPAQGSEKCNQVQWSVSGGESVEGN
jgi:hypothetical protein